LQDEEGRAEFILEAGIEKLDGYRELALRTPAYLLSVGEWLSYEASQLLMQMRTVLNPVSKLEWFIENYSAEFAAQVKRQLLQAVSTFNIF
jgi:hypothetical protein